MAMITSDPAPLAPAALAELKQRLHITLADGDAELAGALRSSLALCEQFTGLSLLTRPHREQLPVARDWQMLTAQPVVAITAVTGIAADASRFALANDGYALEITAGGVGKVRILSPGSAGRAEILYTAGLAPAWTDLPEPLRQGVIRLAAHLHLAHEHADPPPAAVVALWRPWRVVRL
jgi:uncharacterized phiE125 gp8 family phage protein